MQSQPRAHGIWRRALRIAVNLLLGLLIVALLGLAAGYIVLQHEGWRFYAIVTGSMEPTLMKGDVVAVKQVAPWEVKNGDVIAFYRDGLSVPVVHRVYGVQSSPDIREIFQDQEGNQIGEKFVYSPRSYLTKGDANAEVDQGLIPQDNLIGVEKRVVSEPLATVLIWLNGNNLKSLAFLAVSAFIVWEMIDLAKEGLKKRRRPGVAPTPGSDETLA